MSNQKKLKGMLTKKPMIEEDEEDFYDDDFESFDYGNVIDEILVNPSVSTPSIAHSATPETDSAGNNLNSKSSVDLVDYEFLSSLESEYTYGDEGEEDESAGSQAYDFRLFHEVLGQVQTPKKKRFKNGTRSSLTFSNQRVREIERDNQNLLKKIMKHGPAGDGIHNKPPTRPVIKTAHEVNRKKKQQQINYENYLLQRKLDKINGRRATLS